MKTVTSFIFILLIVFSEAVCASTKYLVEYRVSPSEDGNDLHLSCEKSSSGKCYFILGEDGDTKQIIYTVARGRTQRIEGPAIEVPFCGVPILTKPVTCHFPTMNLNIKRGIPMFIRIVVPPENNKI